MIVEIPYLYRPGVFYRAETDASKVDLSKEDQIFSYRKWESKYTFHWNCGELHRQIKANPQAYWILTTVVEPKQAKFVLNNNGIETDHFPRIIDRGLIDTPGILLWWPDDTQTLMDGNHRYVLRYLEQYKTMDFYVVTVTQARMCQLNLPREMDY